MSTVNTVHVVMPDSVYDPGRPSGGNEYDRRLCEELRTAGWRVDVVLVGSPQGGAGLADALGELPDAAVVVVDGLIAAQHADVVLNSCEHACAQRCWCECNPMAKSK